MITSIAVWLLAITLTPLAASFLVLLALAAVVRGIGQGISQPLMYSILGRSSTRHGASVGLRTAVVRLASIITPVAMGIAAETWGIETSFYVIGGVLLVGSAALALVARRLR